MHEVRLLVKRKTWRLLVKQNICPDLVINFFFHLSFLLASNALPQLIRQESNFHYFFLFIYSHFSLHMHTIAHSSFKQSISMQKMVVRINSVISSGGSMLLCFFIFIIVVMFFFIRLHIVFFLNIFFLH